MPGSRIGRSVLTNPHCVSGVELPVSVSVKDLGVLLCPGLKSTAHIDMICKRAYNFINMLFRCFKCCDANSLLVAYKAYVIPVLEYCSLVWTPHLLGDIDRLEAVQRYFTRRLFLRCDYGYKTYSERLRELQLQPLELRRLIHDLVMCYKIIHRDVDLNPSDFFRLSDDSRTRGHPLKLFMPYCRTNVRKYSFACRIIPVWNSLPDTIDNFPVVTARNSSAFKRLLGKLNFSSWLKFSRNLE